MNEGYRPASLPFIPVAGRAQCLLLGLEVVEQDGPLLRLLTPVLDDDARAVDYLPGVAFAVYLACTNDT